MGQINGKQFNFLGRLIFKVLLFVRKLFYFKISLFVRLQSMDFMAPPAAQYDPLGKDVGCSKKDFFAYIIHKLN